MTNSVEFNGKTISYKSGQFYIDGVSSSTYKVADVTGINRSTITSRMSRGIPIEEILAGAKVIENDNPLIAEIDGRVYVRKGGKIYVDGQYKSLEQIGNIFSTEGNTIKKRLARGHSLRDALLGTSESDKNLKAMENLKKANEALKSNPRIKLVRYSSRRIEAISLILLRSAI